MPENSLVPAVEDRIGAWVEFQRLQRIQKRKEKEGFTITISRTFGCEGYVLAEALKKQLESETGKTWTIFDKALIDKINSEHSLSKNLLENLGGQSTFVDEIVAGLSEHWKSERDTFRLMAKTIYSIANEGNAIIVGRGAALISKSLKNAYHFRLEAPLQFRIAKFASRARLTSEEAKEIVVKKEHQRNKFFESFLNQDIANSENYHAIFNNKKCHVEGIASTISHYIKSV